MKLSIITPTHDAWHIEALYRQLSVESFTNWEWIIVPNGSAQLPSISDERIVIADHVSHFCNLPIGGLKAKGAELATGDVIVELDHDDDIVPGALMKIAQCFEDAEVDFAYSNFAEFNDDGKRSPRTFSKDYGWRYRSVKIGEFDYQEAIAPPMIPPYLLNITHAPNHFRCWRASFYRQIGGHSWKMNVADDYDLVVRTYLKARKVHHINSLLYLYRVTGNNSWLKNQGEITKLVHQIYLQNVEDIMLRWCGDNDLKAIDLGAAHNKRPGFLACDVRKIDGIDVAFDLEEEWPFETDSVGVIRCYDTIEHIHTEKKMHFMNEAWRVLAPGGALLIEVPSSDGRGADQDPTHYSRWNENSFWYFTRDPYKKYVPDGIRCSYMARHVETYYPSPFHERHNISYVKAHLFAVKSYGHPAPMPYPSMMPHPSDQPKRAVVSSGVPQTGVSTIRQRNEQSTSSSPMPDTSEQIVDSATEVKAEVVDDRYIKEFEGTKIEVLDEGSPDRPVKISIDGNTMLIPYKDGMRPEMIIIKGKVTHIPYKPPKIDIPDPEMLYEECLMGIDLTTSTTISFSTLAIMSIFNNWTNGMQTRDFDDDKRKLVSLKLGTEDGKLSGLIGVFQRLT